MFLLVIDAPEEDERDRGERRWHEQICLILYVDKKETSFFVSKFDRIKRSSTGIGRKTNMECPEKKGGKNTGGE